MDQDMGYNYQGGNTSYGSSGMGDYENGGNYGMGNMSYDNNAFPGNAAPATPTKTNISKQVVPIVSSMLQRLILHNTDSFSYFNHPVMNVCICGLVSSYRVNPAGSVDYVINDCTGTINGRFYSNAGGSEITDGYVKIIGVLKEFQGKISVNIHNIEPVYDMNVVTEHFLSCINSYLYYKKKGGAVSTINTMDYQNNMETMGSTEQIILSFVKSQIGLPAYKDGVPLDSIKQYCESKGIANEFVVDAMKILIENINLFETSHEAYSPN